MKMLTFILVLVMELSYAMWLIADFMDEERLWPALPPVAAVCGISAVFVWLYCRVRKVADTRAVMKSGTALVFGMELGAVLLYYIVMNWRWLV